MSRRRRWSYRIVLSTCVIAALMHATPGHAQTDLKRTIDEIEIGQTSAAQADAEPGVLVVFVRTGCPHCADAKVFLADYVRDHPSLRVVYRPVDEDPSAAADLVSLYQDLGMWPPSVPTFVMNGQVRVGFRDAEHTGPALRELIEAGLPPPDEVETTLFGTLSASRLGLPLFTIALGLLDGFNPCAMWVLLFLLSLLVRLQNRARMAIIAVTFVLVSAAAGSSS